MVHNGSLLARGRLIKSVLGHVPHVQSLHMRHIVQEAVWLAHGMGFCCVVASPPFKTYKQCNLILALVAASQAVPGCTASDSLS